MLSEEHMKAFNYPLVFPCYQMWHNSVPPSFYCLPPQYYGLNVCQLNSNYLFSNPSYILTDNEKDFSRGEKDIILKNLNDYDSEPTSKLRTSKQKDKSKTEETRNQCADKFSSESSASKEKKIFTEKNEISPELARKNSKSVQNGAFFAERKKKKEKNNRLETPYISYSLWSDIEYSIALIRSGHDLNNPELPPVNTESSRREEVQQTCLKDSYFPYRKYRAKYLTENLQWLPEVNSGCMPRKFFSQQYPKPRGISSLARKADDGKKDKLKFISGIFTSRSRHYQSLNDSNKYFTNLESENQDDIIRLLMHCRKLEDEMQEQYDVLKLLEKELASVNMELKFPKNWKPLTASSFTASELLKERFVPPAQFTPFLRGRVSLLPKSALKNPSARKVEALISAKKAHHQMLATEPI